MLREAGDAALRDVGIHSVAGQDDSLDGSDRAQACQQVVAAAIGKAEIGDQEIEGPVPKRVDGFPEG